MIYLECNMPAYVGYTLADVSKYSSIGKSDIVHSRKIVNLIHYLSMFLEACDANNLKDSMKLGLCAAEVIHIQNMPLQDNQNKEAICHLDTDDISQNINIIDNIRVNNLRFIVINNYTMCNSFHFSILKHDEGLFDSNETYYSIFIDKEFLNKNNPSYNSNVMKLMFICIDHFLADISRVYGDTFSQHDIIFDQDTTSYTNLATRMIFRNRLSTLEIMFISEYLILMTYYLRKWFRLSQIEIQNLFAEFPFYESLKSQDSIFDTIFDAIEDNLNCESGEVEKILNAEFKVGEFLRDDIMNMVYNEE